MENKTHHSARVQGIAIGLHESGYSLRNIRKILEKKKVFVCIQTISNWIKAEKEREDAYEDEIDCKNYQTPKKMSGRPKIIGDETGKKFIDKIEENRETTAVDLQ